MSNCGNCLYQGDRSEDHRGNSNVFCLVRGNWMGESRVCNHFKEYADIDKNVKVHLAMELRREEAESRLVKKATQASMRLVILTMVISFALFWLTVKLFDKYIF